MYIVRPVKTTLKTGSAKSAAILDLEPFTRVEAFEVARPQKQKDESFGQRLRRLRAAKGYTEAELGRVIGSSHRMIAYYEVQGGNPPADVVAKLSRALNASADELLGLQPLKKHKETDGAENLRLMRKLRLVKDFPSKERRQVLQFIDLVIERESLKRAQG
jgi:transcriptional regulator with XRE-family HTH domain